MTAHYTEGDPDDLEDDQEVAEDTLKEAKEKDETFELKGRDMVIIETVMRDGKEVTVFRQVIPKESKINDLNELGTPRTTGPGGWPKR